MRVMVVGAEPEDDATLEDTPTSGSPAMAAQVSTIPVAPPLAMRPIEDAEWTFRN